MDQDTVQTRGLLQEEIREGIQECKNRQQEAPEKQRIGGGIAMKCIECGKEIITTVSTKRGIGPVCYSKLKREQKRQKLLPDEIILTTEMGGEIEQLIRETSLKRYECLGLPAGHAEIVGAWYGYPHEGGLSDKDGRRWWPYQKCSLSNYEMSYWKVKERVGRIQEVLQ